MEILLRQPDWTPVNLKLISHRRRPAYPKCSIGNPLNMLAIHQLNPGVIIQ